MNKCIFLDRDGVINRDKVDYVYQVKDIRILDGVAEALEKLKSKGFMLIVITNQSGIDKKIFTEKDVADVHQEIQNLTGNYIDDFFYSRYHRTISNSLASKPGSLLFEKAIAKHKIDVANSWMVGDRLRDLIPAESLGIKTALVESEYGEEFGGIIEKNLLEIVNKHILN